MTIISTEMLKWKRNKTVLGIFILTAILGIFAVERAFSISRSSSLMNSFSDLYTLAFKNLTSLFLPIVLSMFATTLFFDEQKNDTLKGLLIIPISKTLLHSKRILAKQFFIPIRQTDNLQGVFYCIWRSSTAQFCKYLQVFRTC